MKKKKLLAMALGLLLTMPCFLFAEEQEVEIQLIEVVGASIVPGDEPFDGNGESGNNPTHPNQFHVTISGRILHVYVFNTNDTQLIIRNASGSEVVNAQFVGSAMFIMPTSGSHTLEIHNGGHTFIGNFHSL